MKDFILWALPLAIIFGFFDGAFREVRRIDRYYSLRRDRVLHKGGDKRDTL